MKCHNRNIVGISLNSPNLCLCYWITQDHKIKVAQLLIHQFRSLAPELEKPLIHNVFARAIDPTTCPKRNNLSLHSCSFINSNFWLGNSNNL